MPLFLALGAVFVLLLGGVGYAAYAYFFKSTGPEIVKYVPTETSLYFEIPNVRAAGAKARQARYMKETKKSDEDTVKDFAKVVADSFGITESEAIALALAERSLGISALGMPEKPEGALVLVFEAKSPVETWLKSKRFKAEGAIGKSGRRYALGPATSPTSPAATGKQDWTAQARTMLNAAQTDTNTAIGWWEDVEVLALGTPNMLTAIGSVVDKSTPPLADNERFKRAIADKRANDVMVGWVDGLLVKKALEGNTEGYDVGLGAEGLLIGLGADETGLLMHAVTTLVGRDITSLPQLFEPTELSYGARLPAETLAYTGLSLRTQKDGPTLERELLGYLRQKEPRIDAEYAEFNQECQQKAKVSVSQILGSLGDEMVIGALAPSTMTIGSLDPEKLTDAAAFAALKLKTPTILEQFVVAFRDQVLAQELGPALTPKGKGLVVKTPLGPNVVVELRFVGDELVIAGGGGPMVERLFSGLSGQGPTLGADDAHSAVLASLPKQTQQLLWLDTGRLADRFLAGNPSLRTMAEQSGVPLGDIELTGPKRVSSGLAFSMTKNQLGYQVTLDSTNLVHGFLFAAGASAAAMTSAFADLGAAATPLPTAVVPATVPAGADVCAKVVRCCKTLMARTGQAAAQGNCDTFPSLPPASCAQALAGYEASVRALGGSCD